MPLRMRSKRPIAKEPWCTTQVFPLCPLGIQNAWPNCVLFVFSFVVFFLISFVLWHHRTDRHSSATLEVQKEEEKKFKEVGEAFTVLSDPKKKTRYDNGHDLDDDGSFSGRGNVQFSSNHLWWDGVWFQGKQADSSACFSSDFDANDIFRAFFGGHNDGFSFGSGQGMWFVPL